MTRREGRGRTAPSPEMAARTAAVAVLLAVLQGRRNLDEALAEHLPAVPEGRDRALVRELCYGVLRWLPRLRFYLHRLMTQGLRARDADIECILLLGLYQLTHTRVPPYAAVSSAVALATARRKGWAKGLVNAVLRRYQREQAALEAAAGGDEGARFAHPPWLIATLRAAWPDRWQAVLEANNTHAPMTLRVNPGHVSRDAYLQELAAAGIAARPGAHSPQAVILDTPRDVEGLPRFPTGGVSVQDEAAQLAALLLAPRPGDRVLDACAAPGGKTGHLLELCPDTTRVVALEQDPARTDILRDTLARTGGACEVRTADAGDPASWWDGVPFERILLDAPCSATGVIRRHPDIKIRRRAAQLDALAGTQGGLLEALWTTLAAGGTLLYATCSTLPLENAAVVDAFLATHRDARPDSIDASWGRHHGPGRQILPGEGGMDGFFYARLKKS